MKNRCYILILCSLFMMLSLPAHAQVGSNGEHCIIDIQPVYFEGLFDPATTPQLFTTVARPQLIGCYNTIIEAVRVATYGQVEVDENASPSEVSAQIKAYVAEVIQLQTESLYLQAAPPTSIPLLRMWEKNDKKLSGKSGIIRGTGLCAPNVYHLEPDLSKLKKPYGVSFWQGKDWDNEMGSFELLTAEGNGVYFFEDKGFSGTWALGMNHGPMNTGSMNMKMNLWTHTPIIGWRQFNMTDKASSLVIACIHI